MAFGLQPTAEALDRILDGVFIDAGIAIELQVGPQSRMAAIHLAEYVKRKGIAPAACDIRFGLDPIGACAVWGSSPYAWAEIVPAVTGAIKGLAAMGFNGPFAVADGRVIHDAGGSEAQELAFVLATGVAYLRALEDAGVALEDAQGMIYARLAADADQFLTMAKFRALRLLWARVEQACGLAPKPIFICGRYRMADADPARSLREHAARDHGHVFCGSRAAPTPSPYCRTRWRWDCQIRSRGAWRATRNWCCWRSPISPRCPTPPPAPAASKP